MKARFQIALFFWIFTSIFLVNNTLFAQNIQRSANESAHRDIEYFIQLSTKYLVSHPDSSIYYSKKSLTLLNPEVNQLQYLRTKLILGKAYSIIGQLEKSYDEFTQILPYENPDFNIQLILQAKENLALLYAKMGDNYKAISDLTKLNTTYFEILGDSGVFRINNDIAALYLTVLDNEEAKTYLDLNKLIPSSSFYDKQNHEMNIAWYLLQNQQYDSSLNILTRVWGKIQFNGDIQSKGINLYLATRVYIYQQNWGEAYHHILLALEHFKQQENKYWIIQSHKALSQVNAGQKRFEEAYIQMDSARLLQEMMNFQQITNKQYIYEQEKKQADLDLLKKQSELDINQQKNTQIILYTLLAGLIIIVTILSIYLYQKLKTSSLLQLKNIVIEQKNRELIEVYKESQSANEQLVQTQEELSAQRDALEVQNRHLGNLNNIIEKQALKIKNQNIILEKQVAERTKGLVDYNQRLEQFAYIIAHNMRAPVARILGVGNLITGKYYKEGEFDFLLNTLINETEELDQVIREVNDILDLRNSTEETYSKVNISQQLEFTLKQLKNEIKHTDAQIISNIESDCDVNTIKPYIQNILYNLISNALKYRNPDSDSIITITAKVDPTKFILIVEDTGLGIDLSRHPAEKLFKLYNRLHTHIGGRGLGLFIVKTQIDIMNATIDVESKLNVGTKFTVTFPQ